MSVNLRTKKASTAARYWLQAPPAGLETLDASRWVANNLRHDDFRGAAESGAVAGDLGEFDPELNRVIDAWTTLSDTQKHAILGVIDRYLGLETEFHADG